jgi:hypothetical protein
MHPAKFPANLELHLTLAVRNANYALGPVMLHLVMKPGSSIPAHVHKGVAEVLYVVEGDFINEGEQHSSGTSLHIQAGTAHGPHGSKNGCTPSALDRSRRHAERQPRRFCSRGEMMSATLTTTLATCVIRHTTEHAHVRP